MAERTGKVQEMLATPWAPAVFSLSLFAIPGSDSVLIMGNKTLRERLDIDSMASVKGEAWRGLGRNAEVSAEELPVLATMAREDLEARELPV